MGSWPWPITTARQRGTTPAVGWGAVPCYAPRHGVVRRVRVGEQGRCLEWLGKPDFTTAAVRRLDYFLWLQLRVQAAICGDRAG